MTPEIAMIEVRMRDAGLEQREREVAWLVLEGKSTAEIAAALERSPKTVTNAITRINRRLGLTGARTRIPIIRYLLGLPDGSGRPL